MDEISQKAQNLKKDLDATIKQIDLNKQIHEKSKLDSLMAQPNFWSDNQTAQKTVKQHALLSKRIEVWEKLQKEVDDNLDLIALHDTSLSTDLESQIDLLSNEFNELREELKFNGPYDEYDAILSIYAGAGGTDAQDWTQILFRMYLHWAEKEGYLTKTIEESAGDEAGLKNVTIEISGSLAYGKLKGEQGVHRLVRLSPYNAANLRQTSFAKVVVLPKVDHPDELELDPKDLRIDFYRSSGHGGQSVNTTDSAVRVTHIPTSISVAIQNERSQLQNKETALTLLRSRLVGLQIEQHQISLDKIKGPNQSAEWGNQIRNYVQHPYKQVKDLRTNYETSDIEGVLNGDLNPFIRAYLNSIIKLD